MFNTMKIEDSKCLKQCPKEYTIDESKMKCK